jgi:hypothetical protein
MKQNLTLKAALQGSASALGLNWIYDPALLNSFCKDKSCIFLDIQHDLYKKTDKGYDVYPNHHAGDLDFLGEIMYQLDKFLEEYNNPTPWEFFNYIYLFLTTYDGYIESYGKDLMTRHDKDKLRGVHTTLHIDEQLINMALYFVFHDRDGDSIEQAQMFTKIFTNDPSSKILIPMLHDFLNDLENESLEEALENVKMSVTKPYKESIEKALKCRNKEELLAEISTACGALDAFAMILYIIKNTSSTEEALELNVRLGGASAARGIFICALTSKLYGPYESDKIKFNK